LSGQLSDERVLLKSSMYYSLTAVLSGVRIWTPNWQRGPIYLTNKNLWFEYKDNQWISIPLQRIVDIEKPHENEKGTSVPGLVLAIDYRLSPECIAAVFITGPEIILKSLRDFLLPIVKETVLVREDTRLIELKILSLIQSKIKEISKIAFLLGLTDTSVMGHMMKLYKNGLISDEGELTDKGIEKLQSLRANKKIKKVFF